MIQTLERTNSRPVGMDAAPVVGMLEYLRRAVLAGGRRSERFHAIFLDSRRAYLADVSLGIGTSATLSFRMRDLFARALAVQAEGLIIAHNHPSGDCHPSKSDIVATHRLRDVAVALDIELIDHLILTENSVYSMRAGGDL